MVIHHFNRLIKNKWVWGVFAVAISVFFAFDFLFVSRDGGSGPSVGTLGGKELDAAYFDALVKDARGIGRQSDNRMSNAEANREAWRAAAALAVAKAMHLEATDADVREAIRRDPSFSEGGAFDVVKYERLLRENGLTPPMFEAYLLRRISLQKLQSVVLGSATWVSPTELAGAVNDWTDEFKVRVASYIDKEFDKVKLDDKALEAYYRANTNSFALPDCVQVKFARFQADAPARLAQFKISEDEMHDHYDATSARFETTGTNGVTVTKTFEEVKPILERELQVIASVEAYRTNLLARVYPQDEKKAMDNSVDLLVKVAAEEKVKVQTSRRFSLDGRYVKGFMARPSEIVRDCPDFLSTVSELDVDSAITRYGVAAGTNAVYLVERVPFAAKDADGAVTTNAFEKAHVPSFAEAKEIIRGDALEDARAKAFKARVEKARALAAAEIAKGKKPVDAKMFGAVSMTTSTVFSVSSMARGAFPDAMYVAPATMKLAKGQISDFISTASKRHALLVYVEDRKPGDAAQAEMSRAQLRDDLGRGAAMALPVAWQDWNLNRIGYETTAGSSVETERDDDAGDSAN